MPEKKLFIPFNKTNIRKIQEKKLFGFDNIPFPWQINMGIIF